MKSLVCLFLLQCSYCFKEAQYNCCWNANYCNEACQQLHWPEHMSQCTQVQTPPTAGLPPNPRTPALEGGAKILSPPQGDQSVFTFSESSSSHMPGVIEGGGAGMDHNPGLVGMATTPSLKLSYEYPIQAPPTEGMVATVTTVPDSQTMMSLREDSIVNIERLVNHAAMLVHPTSPQGFQTIMIGQPPPHSRFQAPPTSPVHPSRLIPPPTSSPMSHGMHVPSHAHPNIIHQAPPRPISPTSSPPTHPMDNPAHPHSLHVPPPHHPIEGHAHSLHIAPSSHSMDNHAHSLHVANTFSWPYQQPVAGISHDLSQTLPLLPQLPAHTPTTQPNSFFRVF